MTSPDEQRLLELAGRCEKATGPDRELDGAIRVALNPDEQMVIGQKPGRFPREAIYGPLSHFADAMSADLADYVSAPNYTASLDAAMTLVPEGFSVKLYAHPGECHADVYSVGDIVETDNGLTRPLLCMAESERALTPALALAAASLRAIVGKK